MELNGMNDGNSTLETGASDERLKPTRPGRNGWLAEDRKLLEGPRSRTAEFFRVLRIAREFIRGFRALHFLGPCVTVFGSARFKEDHAYYRLARQIGAECAKLGFTVITGGGPGIMEAANRGAKDVSGRSIGCNIILPEEQLPNPYIDKVVTFNYFFVRKVMLVKYSQAFICLPGGFGTMDEIFEAATLVQTRKIFDFPIILVGTEYWQPLFDFLRTRMLRDHTINLRDYERMMLTDSVEEIVECLHGCPSLPQQLSEEKVETRAWQLERWKTGMKN
jgi:uncharacterized protein (TIGR00730 family)